MSILLYFEWSRAHGRLHRTWWALSGVYQKSMYTLFRFVQETHTHASLAPIRAHPSLRCAWLLLCLPNTKGICARMCAPDSLFHIFWESFVYQKEFFFLKMVVFLMWPNKLIRTQIFNAAVGRISTFSVDSKQKIGFFVYNFCKWSPILWEKMQRKWKTISNVFIMSKPMANVMAAPFLYFIPENIYLFASLMDVFELLWTIGDLRATNSVSKTKINF